MSASWPRRSPSCRAGSARTGRPRWPRRCRRRPLRAGPSGRRRAGSSLSGRSQISVSIGPGMTSRTSTPVSHRSMASASLQPQSANLLARVGRLVGDAEATGDARHVDDDAGVALEHAGEQGQRHARRREEVDPHHVLELVDGQLGHLAALRDGGVVHDHVEVAERVPRLERHPLGTSRSPRSATQRRDASDVIRTSSSTSLQAVLAAGDDAHGGAAPGQLARQRGADARRRAGDQDVAAFHLHVRTLRIGRASRTARSDRGRS